MGDFTTPVNLEDPQVLKMYLDTLSAAIQNVTVLTSSLAAAQGKFTGISTDPAFIEFVDSTQKLNAEIKSLVEGNLETIEKQSSDLSYVIEQFGTNYEQNQAASWYGLTVGAGNILTGFTVGALDYDTSSYGNEDSVFGIHANRFFIGRSPTTQDELDYLADKDQDFLTLYNETGEAIPAFGINWTGSEYEIFFNGVVSFNNVDTGYTDGAGNTIINGGQIQTNSIEANKLTVSQLSAITADIGTITAGVLYNTGGTPTNFTMRIDLNAGSILIKG